MRASAARSPKNDRAAQEATCELLQRLLTLKFGPLPGGVAEKLASASQAELLSWSERVLGAESLESVFASR